jgi:integrase
MITGCRRGELCSLRWHHVDEARSRVWVQRSTAQPTRAPVFERDTKTETDRRISLDPQTMTMLAGHKARAAAQCAEFDVELDDDAFLFSAAPDYSTPLRPRSVTQRYRRMAIRLKLRSTRLHALRHYSATELLAAGVDLRTVAGRLGHGSGGGGATTLKVYAAWVEHADRKAAQYTVAAGTAHRAVAALNQEGLIVVQRGKRATVAPPHAGSIDFMDGAFSPTAARASASAAHSHAHRTAGYRPSGS